MENEKRLKFTKRELEKLPLPEAGRTEYSDTEVNGFRLRVTASGVKTFSVAKYQGGKFIRATIGRFPAVSVEQARMKALELIGEVATTGANPNDTKREQQSSKVTLGEALTEYLSSRGHRIKVSTSKQYRLMLSNFSGDWLEQPLANVTRERVEQRHKAITEGRAWHGADKEQRKGGTGAGSKAQADLWGRILRAVCRFAHDHYRDADGKTLLPEPPTKVLSTKRQWHNVPRKSDRIRSHELARWLGAVEHVRQEALAGRADTVATVCDALDLALFTGLRRSEVFGLTWDRVNMEGRYFWIDETKNGDPLELPITDTLLSIFKRRWNLRKNGVFVFPSERTGKPIQEPRKAIARIVAATMPEPNDDGVRPIEFKCHDARRTFGTVAELVGVGQYTLKRLMNHRTLRSADVTQGYIHFTADELREPAKRIEQAILEHAGLVEPASKLDAHLSNLLAGMSDADKRRLLFTLAQKSADADNEPDGQSEAQ
ncbi:tyrosine-type recombinase/integrase [Aeromonas sanarellii]